MNASTSGFHDEGILVISCDADEETKNVLLKIMDAEHLPNPSEISQNCTGYPWSFETKYYSAKINLYILNEKTELSSDFCETIKAVVFYFDNQKPSSFEDVLSWMPVLKNIEAEVQILVCNNYSDASESTALEKKNVLEWCVKNEYELVELNPVSESDDEDERAFKDVKGYERVVQALQAHMWSNMKTKDEKLSQSTANAGSTKVGENSGKPEDQYLNALACGDPPDKTTLEAQFDKSQPETKASEPGAQCLNEPANGDPPNEMEFEELFAKFFRMKEQAVGLTGDERKKFAEKTVIDFWRAIGGDEDEIAGLEDEIADLEDI